MEITPTIDHSVIDAMVSEGFAANVDAGSLDAFIGQPGLVVLLFAGLKKGYPEGHDVAVAMREFVRAYGDVVTVGIIAPDAEDALKARFRVVLFPSLVFLSGGEVLEVLPRVRDWNDYAGAFRRYLGEPAKVAGSADQALGGAQ